MFTVAESGLSKLKGSIYKNIDLSHRLREYIICDFLDYPERVSGAICYLFLHMNTKI